MAEDRAIDSERTSHRHGGRLARIEVHRGTWHAQSSTELGKFQFLQACALKSQALKGGTLQQTERAKSPVNRGTVILLDSGRGPGHHESRPNRDLSERCLEYVLKLFIYRRNLVTNLLPRDVGF